MRVPASQFSRLGLALVAAALLAACSAAPRFPEDPREACEFVVMLDKQVYRVGEMVVAKVAVSNRAMVPIVIAPPHSVEAVGDSNLHFRMLEVGGSTILRRAPVVLSAKPRSQAVRLEPFETLVEKYAFVNLTTEPGRFRVMVEYLGNPQPDVFPHPDPPEVTLPMARVVEYEVREPALFRRDANGLILHDEAIRIAAEHYARPVRGARAVLVEDQDGSARLVGDSRAQARRHSRRRDSVRGLLRQPLRRVRTRRDGAADSGTRRCALRAVNRRFRLADRAGLG